MKTSTKLFFTILVLTFVSCNNQSGKSVETKTDLEITTNNIPKVYYFHYSRRCNTCVAVEAVVSSSIKELYGENVNFSSLNLDEEEVEKLAQSMKISGQSLVVVFESKQIDLTNEAFLYARKNPDKLKEKLKETIDPLI